MDLKVVFLIVFLSVLAITSTHAGIPKCCISTKRVSERMLRRVERWERQHSNGACDIDALVVYEKNKKMPRCVDPRLERFLRRQAKQQQMQQNRRV